METIVDGFIEFIIAATFIFMVMKVITDSK